VIRKILEKQKKVVEQWRANPESINPYRVLILDDVITDAGQSRELADLAVMARHFKICVMLTDQHPQLLCTGKIFFFLLNTFKHIEHKNKH
jgi:hypothetical protein